VELPTLHVIPIDSVLLHEAIIPDKVQSLASIIESDGVQKNPIIVSPTKDREHYIVIDGIHRAEALRELGCVSVVASLVDYADTSIELSGWSQVFFSVERDELLSIIKKVCGREPEQRDFWDAAHALATRRAYFGCAFRKGEGAFLFPCNEFSVEQWAVFDRALMAEIRDREIDHRPVSDDYCLDVFERDEDIACLCRRPVISKEEVVRMALARTPLPSDTTRHIIPNRPLGLNTPLGLLKAHVPMDVANSIIEAEVQNRWTKGAIRHYPDSVYIYDE
jgi:hypothetical protein